jgi:hypothetical protein
MTQAEMATSLDLSKGQVSKYTRRGMPLDSVESARAWIRGNIRLRMKPMSRKAYAESTLAEAQGLMDLAAAALAAGKHRAVEVLVPDLQDAMRRLPESHRERLVLDFEVITHLVRPMLEILRDEPDPGHVMDDTEAEFMGRYWYAMAAREPFPWPME